MSKKEDKKILVMKNGKRFTVIDETPKYYICKDTQFRKANKEIAKIDIKKVTKEEKEETPKDVITEKVETETEGE